MEEKLKYRSIGRLSIERRFPGHGLTTEGLLLQGVLISPRGDRQAPLLRSIESFNRQSIMIKGLCVCLFQSS